MKKLFFLFIFLSSLFVKSQDFLTISGLSATQTANNQIKINLKVFGATYGEYLSYKTEISENVITLSVCYFMTDLGSISNFNNDFFIAIPTVPADYSLKVEVYMNVNPTICNYQNLEDSAVLNFTTPIVGTVSLNTLDIEKKQERIELYPNPTKDFLNIKTQSKIEQIDVFDASGKKVLSFSEINGNKVNVSKLENGLYFMEIRSNNRIFRNRFLVQK